MDILARKVLHTWQGYAFGSLDPPSTGYLESINLFFILSTVRFPLNLAATERGEPITRSLPLPIGHLHPPPLCRHHWITVVRPLVSHSHSCSHTRTTCTPGAFRLSPFWDLRLDAFAWILSYFLHHLVSFGFFRAFRSCFFCVSARALFPQTCIAFTIA